MKPHEVVSFSTMLYIANSSLLIRARSLRATSPDGDPNSDTERDQGSSNQAGRECPDGLSVRVERAMLLERRLQRYQ